MKLPSIKWKAASADERIPRVAIVVVAVGLIATLAAALLTGGSSSSEFAHLEWVQQAKIPDSKAVSVPGDDEAEMQLIDGKIQETGTNVEGYSLFRVLNTVKIDAGAPIGGGKLICSTAVLSANTLIAQTHGELRATYPRSSEDGIYGQSVEEEIIIKFASHGHTYAVLEVGEELPEKWTTVQGVKLDWPEYEVGTEHLLYLLPKEKQSSAIELPFYTVWRGTTAPAAAVSCRLEVAAGKATVETKGKIAHISPPIDEEAEAEHEEEREEEGEALEEKESEESD